MTIDYNNSVTMNIHKQWDGQTDDGVSFVIDGGWNEHDNYYVNSISFIGEVKNEEELIEQITNEFLMNMN
jgi:hypothetical protein